MGARTNSVRAIRTAVGIAMLAFVSAAQAGESSSADTTRGEQLATNGAGSVAACASRHGKNGDGNAALAYPMLAGQHAGYLENQLQAWQHGSRSNDPNGLMTAIAARLEKDDIRAVAEFLSNFHQYPEPTAAFVPRERGNP